MFTGIITDVGTVSLREERGDTRLKIETSYAADGIDIGASIACNGVCLTVTETGREGNRNWFAVDCSAETLDKTTIGDWQAGTRINLERALRVGDEMGGHVVSGHVDGLGEIIGAETSGDSTILTIRVPESIAPYIAPKGSVALDGTSLTVNDVAENTFTINLIRIRRQ